MSSPTLNEIRLIELKLEEFIVSSEQSFLQLGQQLAVCRSRGINITGINDFVSGNTIGDQLHQLEPDLKSLKETLATRNQCLDFTLRQSLDIFAEYTQHDEIIKNRLLELNDLARQKRNSSSIKKGSEPDIQENAVGMKETGDIQFDSHKLGKKQKSLLQRIMQSKQIIEHLQLKAGTQRSILQGKVDAFFSCVQENDRQIANKNKLGEQNNLINGHIDELVSWLQFDDIARQKIGHVKNALADLRCEIARLNKSEKACNQDSINYLMAEVCKLQAAHLYFVQNELELAVMQISDQFTEIESCCGNIIVIIHDVMKSFSCRDGTGIGRLDFFLEQLHDGLAFHGVTFDVVDGCREDLKQDSSEIIATCELLEHEIMNLQRVFAITMSEMNQASGDYPGVSEFVKGFKTKTVQSVEMLNALSKLFQQAADCFDLSRSLLNRLKDGAISSVDELRKQASSIRQKIQTVIPAVYHQGQVVVREIEPLRAGMRETCGLLSTLRASFQMINEVRLKLVKLSKIGKDINENDLDGYAREILAQLHNRYTMQSERQTHARVATNSESPEGESDARESDSALGSNVELF